jgi:tellurite resistance protein
MPLKSFFGSIGGAVRRLLDGKSQPVRKTLSGSASSTSSAGRPQQRPLPPLTSARSAAPTGSDWPEIVVQRHMVPLAAPIWLGVGRHLNHGGFEIRDPLVYVYTGDSQPDGTEPAAVDLRQPVVASAFPGADPQLGYWPRYDEFSADQRGVYLQWLARGRTSAPPQLGHMFVFLYGLERRALVDGQDVKLIFKEVLRLRDIYARSRQPISRSFDNYTSSFLWFLLLREPAVFAIRHFELVGKSTHAWDDDRLAFALSWLATAGQALPDWLAFALAGQLPKSQRSVVVKRVGDEMRELFAKRYRELFGAGITLRTSKRARKYWYRPASAALRAFEIDGPNPMGMSSQFNKLSDLWNECIVDLKRLSSVVAGASGEKMTVETWNALPAELQAGVDHPLADQFTRFIEEHTADSAHTIAPTRALATLAGIPAEAKLTAAVCRRMGDIVENIGYCVEPDARLTGRSYEPDGSVIIFLNLADGTTDPTRYSAASTLLGVGLALAQIDGRSDEGELSLLTQHIDSAFELNEHEQRRLSMFRALLVAKGADLSDVTKPLKRLPQTERERVAKFALALVAADGVVTKDEQKAVRRLYSALGFERDQADAAIAAMMTKPANDNEPVTVLQAGTSPSGEVIPAAPGAKTPLGLKLDRTAIAAILKDTLEVSRMLSDAMNLDAQQASSDSTGAPLAKLPTQPRQIAISAEAAVDPSVPARYAAFYQVILTRSQWPRAELSALAKQHGLMLAGAVEAINDWSTGKHGGPLLYEDDQHFTLESAYTN